MSRAAPSTARKSRGRAPVMMREANRAALAAMRAESPLRYWWDYVRLRACFYSWLVERDRRTLDVTLYGDGLTVHIITN